MRKSHYGFFSLVLAQFRHAQSFITTDLRLQLALPLSGLSTESLDEVADLMMIRPLLLSKSLNLSLHL